MFTTILLLQNKLECFKLERAAVTRGCTGHDYFGRPDTIRIISVSVLLPKEAKYIRDCIIARIKTRSPPQASAWQSVLLSSAELLICPIQAILDRDKHSSLFSGRA